MNNKNLVENNIVNDSLFQHCKPIMPKFVWKELTNSVRFTI